MNKSETAFLELLTAGLWGREAREEMLRDSDVDWERVVELARQQTVVDRKIFPFKWVYRLQRKSDK